MATRTTQLDRLPSATLLGRYYVHLHEMTWPAVTQEVRELEWKLRYAQKTLTGTECFVLASIVSAYVQMVGDTQAKRNMVCREIREASKLPNDGGER